MARRWATFFPEWRELGANAIYILAVGVSDSPIPQGHVPGEPGEQEGRQGMARILKLVVVLALLAVAGLAGYAYLGDLSPAPQEIRQPVTLNGG